MNVYIGLLAVKQLRETQAEARVAREHAAAVAARTAHEQAQRTLERLQTEERETEQQLYRELCDRVVHVRDIDEVKLTVIALREQVARQRRAVKTAQEVQRAADLCLAEARTARVDAQRQTAKFVALCREVEVELLRGAEQREEVEMEESAMALRIGRGRSADDTVRATSSEDVVS